MSDGLNDARAIRVAEIMGDFRSRQHYIANLRLSPSPEEYYQPGFVLIRECISEAQRILAHPYAASADAPRGDREKEKTQLRGVIIDAGVRRFQVQRAFLRAQAAQRWIRSREAILKGSETNVSLEDIDQTLREELAALTDDVVLQSLNDPDEDEGKWLAEDPSLATIQGMIQRRLR